MKCPIRTAFQRIQYSVRPFAYWLAPVIFLLATLGTAYLATVVELSEKAQPYSVFFLILAFMVSAFFLLITLPCVLYSVCLSVLTMIRQKHYVLPAVQLVLNVALLAAWLASVQKLVI